MFEAVYCDQDWRSLFDILQISVHDLVGPLCTTPELEIQTVYPASCEVEISQEYEVTVRGNDMPDWNLLVECCGCCCYTSEELNISPHWLCDVELLFRFPHCFVGFHRQKFLIMMFLDWNRHVRFLGFPLENTALELNFSAMNTSYWSAIKVHLI